jgi:hypothetical protein
MPAFLHIKSPDTKSLVTVLERVPRDQSWKKAEQGFAADALQRSLRSRFQARLTPGVSSLEAELSEYLRTNLWIDAVTSLEAAQEFCASVTLDQLRWKWVLMAVHFAIQGFMALALEQGNALLVMKDRVGVKWLEAYTAGGPYPKEQMDVFLSLYDKVKSDVVCRYVHSKKFVPGASHDSSMIKLNELRNAFALHAKGVGYRGRWPTGDLP